MSARSMSWPDLDRDEWVRGSWQARWLSEPEGSNSSYSDGRLILTNQRLLFASCVSSDELAAVKFDEHVAIQHKRYRFSLHTLVVEASSGQRFAFRTTKMACKQIEARSRMRRITKG